MQRLLCLFPPPASLSFSPLSSLLSLLSPSSFLSFAFSVPRARRRISSYSLHHIMSSRRVVITTQTRSSNGSGSRGNTSGGNTGKSLSQRFGALKPSGQKSLNAARDERRTQRSNQSSANRANAIDARRKVSSAPSSAGRSTAAGARGAKAAGGARGGRGGRGGRAAGGRGGKKKVTAEELDKELLAYRLQDPKFVQDTLDKELDEYASARAAVDDDDAAAADKPAAAE
jgi:hypothetical protein